MRTTFSTTALISTHLWLDNYITQNGQAFFNNTSRLYYQPDPSLPTGYVAYASSFRSWVCDSGVSGAFLPTSISGTTGPLTRTSGAVFDFNNGRVLLPSSYGANQTITGTYAVKEINVYKMNETADKSTFTDKYYLNSRFGRPATGIPPAGDLVTPCIYITDTNIQNENWAFGGVFNTTRTVTLNVIAENMGQLEGVLSLLADAKYVNFPQLNTNVWPLNPLGDWKSGYNYQTILNQYGSPGNQFTITSARSSKVSDAVKLDDDLECGVVELEISKPRTIH